MEIRKHPFVTKFPKTEAEQIVASSKIQVYKAGTVIFEEDSISNLLYLLLEGDVDFLKKTNTGKYSPVSSAEAGSFFGELGILTGESRKLRAKARNDVRVGEVPGALLLDFLKKSSPFLLEVLNNVTTHLKTTTDHYLQERIQKEKLQAVGQMVRSIVHDLRNPFSIISLATYMIGQEHDDKKTQEQCDLIKDQTNYVMALAEDITAFSEGYKSLKKITVSMKDMFAKFQTKHEHILKTSTCPIEFIDNDLSANLDQEKMIRVLKNLVENAIESVDTKSNGRIRVLARAKDGELSLSVADNGRGIPEDIREYLFEPFAAPPGGKEGSGLGAAIAKSVVEAHNGRLTYASETGKGTTFTIRIPIE
ncbi:MAG: ATP-binding protein [Verrucomicrobia bacterium]|nr:ATP-binding protein [Verrucomicrobiota bacterium]MDA1065655.1 ATP-binding protein [Verrucomicrobiota bacterium]